MKAMSFFDCPMHPNAIAARVEQIKQPKSKLCKAAPAPAITAIVANEFGT